MTDERVNRERRRALTVGTLTLAAALVLVALVLLLGPARILSGRAVAVDFGYAGPIKTGASVRVSGIVIGAVTGVELLADGIAQGRVVRVHARIEENAAALVTDRARYYVTTLGVLGEHYLDVEPVAGGTPLADGARVDGVTLPRPDLLLPRAAGLLERADALLPSSPEALELMKQAGALMKRVDALLATDGEVALSQDTEALLSDLRRLVHGAATGVGDGASLKQTLDAMPGVLRSTERLEATLVEADLRALFSEVRAAALTANAVGARLNQSPLLAPELQEELRKQLMNAFAVIDSAGRRADRLMRAVEEKKGSAGKLFWDEAFADDVKGLARELRENPVKLLWPGK